MNVGDCDKRRIFLVSNQIGSFTLLFFLLAFQDALAFKKKRFIRKNESHHFHFNVDNELRIKKEKKKRNAKNPNLKLQRSSFRFQRAK
jgi:hypothetical protein